VRLPRPTRANPKEAWRKMKRIGNFSPYLLIAPSFFLSIFVIGYPIFDVLRMSVFKVNRFGKLQKFNGLGNFIKAFSDDVFIQTIGQTAIWTVTVVGGTVLLSIPIAMILNEDFYGRSVARTIILLPWAVSLAMTAVVWTWVVNGDFGTLNMTLNYFGLMDGNYVWLANADAAFAIVILIGILVSIPFTVTIFLGGLTSIPDTLYEAAVTDGATGWKRFRYITMPLLKPFTQIAVVLNVIYVFNSFPLIWIMTNGGPANQTDILITYVYKQAFRYGKLDKAAAGSVVMFAMLVAFTVLYFYITRDKQPVEDASEVKHVSQA
jgi:multiple sugar transport system permease protein